MFLKDYNMSESRRNVFDTMLKMPTMRVLLVGGVATGKTSILNTLILEYYQNTTPVERMYNIMHITNLKDYGINVYKTYVKSFCQTCSTIRGKKKILILDNLDLLNEQSQQIFRTLMDKYNHAVHFIASCTNIQKVIENLQSRFISISLPPIQQSLLYAIVHKIKTADKLTIDADAEKFIVDISNNCIKTVTNSMERFKLLNCHITLDVAMNSCTDINFFEFEEYIRILKIGQLSHAIRILRDIYNTGYSVIDILDNFFAFVKTTVSLSNSEKYNIIPVICKYIAIFNNIHENDIELALFTNNIWQATFEKLAQNTTTCIEIVENDAKNGLFI
jgi:DNA polymerase III delta prime subunit